MPKLPPASPTDFRISRLLAAMAFAVLAACSTNPPQTGGAAEEAQEEGDDPVTGDVQAAGPETENRGTYPNQELTENLLYEYLLAEIAGQRGNVALSAQAYVDLAKRTRDPRIARRATEIALYARMNNAAIEAATIWHEADPTSTRALQALAGMLVSVGRYDEALPRLKELLSGSASDTANGFAQLTRTLNNAQNKLAALRLTQNLAADYPKLPSRITPWRGWR
jgi:thioredoxin-like negative regulator of GroEL